MDGELQEVRQRTKPEIVILSYFISVLGAQTTLELLGRRTSHLGIINWLRLIGAAFSMGFVGIWTMHFVGQKALVLGDGRPEEQLRYDIWYKSIFFLNFFFSSLFFSFLILFYLLNRYTLLSLIVPILVLLLAFYSIGAQPQVDLLRLLSGGTTAGLTVGKPIKNLTPLSTFCAENLCARFHAYTSVHALLRSICNKILQGSL